MTEQNDFDVIINTDRLCLKTLDAAFANMILEYYKANGGLFSRYMPGLNDDYFTIEYHIKALWDEFEQMAEGKSLRLYIFSVDDYEFKKIIGDIYIFNIEKRHCLSCEIAYKLDLNYRGNGFMTEAVKAVIKYLFDELSLHRIELNILPENTDSIRLAERLNFQREGIVRDYVFLNGKWCDHIRFSLINKAKK